MLNKIKCILKNIYRKKVKYSGLMAAFLYLIDEIFNISEKCNLSPGWHFAVVTVLFLLIGYAIHAKEIGDDSTILEDYLKEKMELYGNQIESTKQDDFECNTDKTNKKKNK
ncbi:hypothetical protein [Haloplasma contractile]|uniref:Uncharacterized protein n=1 Tax=Haloplasma contractile SSD-17B TaxID=1033810 RepID=F7Q0G2_9MOLU|nr:hypothetical protein [Haloplasma contractile]ERJ12692.1 hypothetical protein HLPCO_001032 [Haloplasma contractile SSD-17B]